MTQYSFGIIDPQETSGSELAQMLSQFADAVYNGHRGNTRPLYAKRGTLWFNDSGGRYMYLMIFDGLDDILLGTVDTHNNTFQAAFDSSAINIAALGGVPVGRTITATGSIVGGGNLGADFALSLANDSPAPGALRYYGTDANGTKGFFPLPGAGASGGTIRVKLFESGPGNYNYVVPANCIAMDFDIRSGSGGNSIQWTDMGTIENPNYQPVYHTGAAGCRATGTIQTIAGETIVLAIGAKGVDASAFSPGGFVSGTAGGWSQMGAEWFYISGGAAGNQTNNPAPGVMSSTGANINRVYNWGFYSDHFGAGAATLWGWLRV